MQLWRRPDLPAGGTCGTAWCNYPFPGNNVVTVSNTLAVAVPSPPDPLDWWRGRHGGWVCGNGWFHGRRGAGGFGFGPWWPPGPDGSPQPGLGGPVPGPEADGEQPADQPDPPVTSTPRPPPGMQPPPAPTTCDARFVEAISKYSYGKPPYGRRLSGSRVGAPPAQYAALPEYGARIRWARLPDGWTRQGGYTYAWSDAQVQAEVTRNRAYWANYCVRVSDTAVTLPDDERLRRYAVAYRGWLDRLPRPSNPNSHMGLGDDMTDEGVALLAEAGKIHAQVFGSRKALRGATHVLFMPRVLGRVGHAHVNRRRATEASFTVPAEPLVVLNKLDADDPYILTHELIHAWGRPPGRMTSDHQSGDPRAISRVTRRTLFEPAGLDGSRLLDYGEYDEILSSGNLRPLVP